MSDDRQYTVSARQVCARLGISRRTLRRWWRSGAFPAPMRLGPRLLFWDAVAFRKWCQSQRPLDIGGSESAEVPHD